MSTTGRPRNREIDNAILVATRDLLVEVGYARLTMEAVAGRAGISKPTLYLRYPNRVALVTDAIFGKTKVHAFPNSGSLREDLREAYRWAVDEFTAPEARAALPGLLAESAVTAPIMAAVGSEYTRVRDRLEQARAAGEIRDDADLDLVVDAFIGTALARILLVHHTVDYSYGDRLVDQLLDGVRSR